MVNLAGGFESAGSGMLLLGLSTLLGASMVTGALGMAASVNSKNGLWVARGGRELPLVYAAAAEAELVDGA
ncbi:hypothetical protein SAMN04489752_1222 [Brevibacterium siliguriense]|uniref:Uncharacterized protein n=2 Tax=Brevibacterium siliguriense TaxID=1136497 RepID=A0A1H1QCS2_9MICO|nr:hypothetical protein [Brevibacterium siliguriense]SDS21292.1 hypothetical protein SAMN04489752_1222 [Brevibacterium siliguriense]